MRQRIVSGLQWMVAFAAMLLAGAVFWQQSRMFAELRQAREEEAAQRQALAAMLDQLKRRAEAAVPVGETADNASDDAPEPPAPPGLAQQGPPVLTLKFVQETENGPPVTPAMLSLIGSSGQAVALDSRASVAGGSPDITIAHSIEPDLYELTVLLNDGQQSARPLSIRDEQPRELTIICPAPRKKAPVAIAIEPLPDKLQKEKFDVSLVIWAAPVEVGHVKWVSLTLPGYRIAFDGQTGLPTAITTGSGDPGEHRFELRDLPADERRAFLPVGNVNYRFEASRRLIGAGSTPIYNWPDSSSDEDRLDHTVGLDDKPWKVAMSNEYLEKLLSAQESTGY